MALTTRMENCPSSSQCQVRTLSPFPQRVFAFNSQIPRSVDSVRAYHGYTCL